MSNYIFLTKTYNEGTTTYYAIPEDKIERMALSDTYGDYGQKVGAEDAGDSIVILIESAAVKINSYLESIEEESRFEKGDCINAYEQYSLYNNITENIEFEEGEIEEIKTSVEGFTYWDGHNFKTITTSTEVYEPSHSILEDENLVKELNEAIENREFKKEGFGKKIYTAGSWVVIDDYCQGTWSSYEVMSKEDYEVTMY